MTNILDFSANINPLGMPDSVHDAIIQSVSECAHYPDPNCTELVKKLAEFEHISESKIVCGNGAADLIYRIVDAFKPRRALICAPTFSEYRFALSEIGCEIREFLLDSTSGFSYNENILSEICNELDMIFLCTPNNPTGQRISPDLLHQIAEKCRKNDILLICDECFLRFTENAEQYSLHQFLYDNCITIHAFTKLYGVPGLRLGYAICGSENNAEKIRQTGQYWSVSVPAQAAGIAALQMTDWIPKTIQFVKRERQFLYHEIRQMGIFVFEGTANFLLMEAPEDFAEQMEQKEIIVRKCDGFHGLSKIHFRIAVRTHEENLALISAMKEVYK